MNDGMIRIRAHKEPWWDAISLLICECSYDGKIAAVAEPLVMKKHEDGSFIAEPTIRVNVNSAQVLMDELWQCGLRPSEGSGSAGSLRATERHLEDMRKLVFKDIA